MCNEIKDEISLVISSKSNVEYAAAGYPSPCSRNRRREMACLKKDSGTRCIMTYV